MRLEPWVRQQANLLWKMQQLNDRLQRQSGGGEAALDPTGVGFAYGSVFPGVLHGKGLLHETHKVNYSINSVGRYLLHVRVRDQSRPIAGSPFALVVEPGVASPHKTWLQPEHGQMRGEVGLSAGDGCQLVVRTYDRTGNMCRAGGAKVTTGKLMSRKLQLQGQGIEGGIIDDLQSTCIDNADGTYRLTWKSKKRGPVDVEVLINGQPVRGSPMRLDFVSTKPLLHKTVLSGEGLKMAVAGRPAPIKLALSDEYSNASSPEVGWRVVLAITNSKKKLNDIEDGKTDYKGEWSLTVPGEYHVSYIATQAGTTDLHVWREMEGVAREAFPDSPFSVHVTSGEAVASNSKLDQWSVAAVASSKSKGSPNSKSTKEQVAESAAMAKSRVATAGDTVSVRASGIDQYGNVAHMMPEMLRAIVVKPDKTSFQQPMSDVTKVIKGGKDVQAKGSASTMYEVRLEAITSGTYEFAVELGGVPIVNSPIQFAVEPSAPVPQHSKLVPPENAEALRADLEAPSAVMLHTYDRYGNRCIVGGLRVAGRLAIVKQSQSDNTVLQPNNNSLNVVDNGDGTYSILVAVMMTSTVKLIVNMDKDMPGTTGEMPPVQLSFVKADAPKDDAETHSTLGSARIEPG